MQVTVEQCPICGAPIDGPTCEFCQTSRAHHTPPERLRAHCRVCDVPLPRHTRNCDVCGADNPTSLGGIAPVAQLVLGFTVLAAVLLVYSLCFGPIVG